MMSAWTTAFFLTTCCYAALGLYVIAQRNDGEQRLYGFLCLTTALWQSIWAALFARLPFGDLYDILKVSYTGILFAPPIFYHFIIAFTKADGDRRWLLWNYGLSFLLSGGIWGTNLILDGFNDFSWGIAAKAGRLHFVFSLLVSIVIARSAWLLVKFSRDPLQSAGSRSKAKVVGIATAIYCGGSIDLLSNYGIPMPPLSFVFTGVALLLYGYAMFRHDFLTTSIPKESDDERLRREAASEEMNRLGMVAAFPLVSQGELLGYLLLGEKRSEEAYSKEDLLLLRIVANQAALAYQRVRYLEMAVHGARTEMLGEIAGGFAHEMKTPLANITLPAELSLMELNDVEKGAKSIQEVMPELKAHLKQIMQQAFKASDKIEAIRQFSKPGQILLEAVSLPAVVQGSLAILDHVLRKLGTEVRAEIPASVPNVRGNAKQLEIVFVNLMKNAAEAMASMSSTALARRLELRASEEGDWVVVRVKDSGPGIKRTDFAHLFEAYFTTKGSTGTGMGLFLSHQVIKAHGGSIDVKSEEGSGTEFIIKLPKFAAQDHSNVFKAA
jgi:signal transduction histidine kinase